MAMSLLDRIVNHEARIVVVGLGYVGLPLAVEFARAGFPVVGYDLDARKAEAVNAGRSYIPDVPTPTVAALVEAGRLSATTDEAALDAADAVLICVPTPLGKSRDPDMSFIAGAVDMVARHRHPDLLVVLESTTYPGTTEEVLAPTLTAPRDGGRRLTLGKDLFLAFSPERVDPGNRTWTTRNTPKVLGGMTPACTAAARTLYQQAVERVVVVSSPTAAEMAKLLENTFRAVNIALVNEIALMCHALKIDVWEVIEAARTKPFGFMPFYPGPGLGGHCIPVDPFYLSWKARMVGFEARFIDLAGQVNGSMPHHVVRLVADALNDAARPIKGSRVHVLGVAYKRDADDLRQSPALDVLALLAERGADLVYSDPFIPAFSHLGRDYRSVPADPESLARADCVVVLTDHSAFDWRMVAKASRLVVDTRNALREHPSAKVRRL